MTILTIGAAWAFSATGSLSAEDSAKEWFQAEEKKIASTKGSTLAIEDIGKKRQALFADYKKAHAGSAKAFLDPIKLTGSKIKAGEFSITEGHKMKYVNFERGAKPEGGWPLLIAMHGGGGTSQKLAHPHAWPVNSREWNAQINLSARLYPNNCLYFVPRMVNDNNGRWWRDFNVTAFEAMIKHAIVHWDVNPNKVYMLGISEGGYGTEVLSSWMPDKLAASSAMACGSGTSVFLENLRNLPFRTDVGERDTAFGRVKNAKKRHDTLKSLNEKDPKGYTQTINVQKGRGHGINYQPGPAWLLQHSRNTYPERVVYSSCRNDKELRHGAYWVSCLNDLAKRYIYLDATSKDNKIKISAKATKADGIYQSPDWQQAIKQPVEKVKASGLQLRIWLHEKQIDFSKPLTIEVNGESQTITPKATSGAMLKSLKKFGDPCYIYAGYADITVK